MKSTSTRDQIVQAADDLFYRQGYEPTSFADIATAVAISRGNFYFHFPSKDEILHAVLAAREERTRKRVARWEASASTAPERVQCFIQMLVVNRAHLRKYGCPIGTLCSELGKLAHPARGQAGALLALFRDWLRDQFIAMGCAQPEALALHLLGRSQGIATLAHALQDERFVLREVEGLTTWLEGVAASAAGRTAAASARRPRHRRSRAGEVS